MDIIGYIVANWVAILAIIAGVVRVVESVAVLTKNNQVLSFINIIKEFLKLG